MDSESDYYGILGVLPNAEEVVIRAAYKALAQRYHPDRTGGDVENDRYMADINQAYSILSDPKKRREYDDSRGQGTHSSDTVFDDDLNREPSSSDPLQDDWKVALDYYPDLGDLEAMLSRISWRLSYSFRAYLLESKEFKERQAIAKSMERTFLEMYFGQEDDLVFFAKQLIDINERDALKALNRAICVLGTNAEPSIVLPPLIKKFNLPSKLHYAILSKPGYNDLLEQIRNSYTKDFRFLNELDKLGNAPLVNLIRHISAEKLLTFLAGGANPTKTDASTVSPIYIAEKVRPQDAEIIEMLKMAGELWDAGFLDEFSSSKSDDAK